MWDGLLVRSSALSGDEAWVVVQYEYTPGFGEIDAVAAGGQGHYWLNDFVKLGLTASRDEDGGASLYGADLTLRKSTESWLKFQAGTTEGLISSQFRSDDGGFTFFQAGEPGATSGWARAYRADASVRLSDFLTGRDGRLTLYAQQRDAGYSAPGLGTPTDLLQFGGTLRLPITERVEIAAKADRSVQDEGLE